MPPKYVLRFKADVVEALRHSNCCKAGSKRREQSQALPTWDGVHISAGRIAPTASKKNASMPTPRAGNKPATPRLGGGKATKQGLAPAAPTASDNTPDRTPPAGLRKTAAAPGQHGEQGPAEDRRRAAAVSRQKHVDPSSLAAGDPVPIVNPRGFASTAKRARPPLQPIAPAGGTAAAVQAQTAGKLTAISKALPKAGASTPRNAKPATPRLGSAKAKKQVVATPAAQADDVDRPQSALQARRVLPAAGAATPRGSRTPRSATARACTKVAAVSVRPSEPTPADAHEVEMRRRTSVRTVVKSGPVSAVQFEYDEDYAEEYEASDADVVVVE